MANLTVVADFGWAEARVLAVNVSHAALEAASPVLPGGWDQAIAWVMHQAGPRLALSQLWEDYVRAPAAPWLALENVATGGAGDEWRGLSADLRITLPAGAPLRGWRSGGAYGHARNGWARGVKGRGTALSGHGRLNERSRQLRPQ